MMKERYDFEVVFPGLASREDSSLQWWLISLLIMNMFGRCITLEQWANRSVCLSLTCILALLRPRFQQCVMCSV